MSVWIIAKRELAERKLVWALAAFVSAAGIVLPWLKHVPVLEWALPSAGLQIGFVAGISIILGAGTLAGDLASRRLAFWFDLPVRPGAILAGRLLAVWILAVGGGFVVHLPQVLLHPAHAHGWLVLDAVAGGLAIPLILGFHVLGTAWAARSPWLLALLATASLAQYALVALETVLVGRGAFGALLPFLGAAVILTTAVLALASGLAIARGRLDAPRTCRVLALGVLAGSAATLAVMGIFTLGVVRGVL